MCAELLSDGVTQQAQFGHDPVVAAVHLYHSERKYLLSSLLQLIRGRMAEGISSTLVSVIRSFIDSLVEVDKLRLTILSLISSLEDALTGLPFPAIQTFYVREERKTLAECVFYMAHQSPFAPNEAFKLLSTLRTSASKQQEQKQQQLQQEQLQQQQQQLLQQQQQQLQQQQPLQTLQQQQQQQQNQKQNQKQEK